MTVSAIPAGYHSITPYLTIRDARSALDFYQKALGATLVMELTAPDGTIAHAELQIGDSKIMLSEENPEWGCLSPSTLGGAGGSLMIYLADVDAAFERAIAAGGTELRPVVDQFYGDRSGTFKDPFGHTWTLSTHIEDVSPEVMKQRMDEWMAEWKAQQPA